MFKKIVVSSAMSVLALACMQAQAAETANVNVTLDVTAGCQVFVGAPNSTAAVDTANLDFGDAVIYGSGLVDRASIEGATGAGALGSANTVGVSCGDNGAGAALTPVLTLTSGINDDSGSRYVMDGVARVAYSVHNTAARDVAIANGDVIALTPDTTVANGDGWTATLYGKVTTPTAIPAAGNYTDTLLLTLTY